MRIALLLATAVACSGGTAATPSTGSAPTQDLDLGGLGGTHAAVPAKPVAADPPAPVKPSVTGTALATGGVDFADDAKLLYRIAACGGQAAERLEGLDAAKLKKIAERHCKHMLDQSRKFRAAYFEKHRGWFTEVVPKDVSTVVYPFGGGDLLSALVAFPEAREITTISLELAGDPRRLRKLTPNQLDGSLAALRVAIGGLVQVGSNTSVNLSRQQRNELPGQVSSFLIGLAVAGYEPVSMRYFTLADDGAIRYLEQADIDGVEKKRMKSLKGDWASPNFSEAFSHVEIQYRRPGEQGVRVHRHFGWNLGDEYLVKNPQLLRHLEAKGKVTMLTKGGSYLLQRPDFSQIRNYMLENLTWMLSDSTGIAPTYVPATMVQDTYGTYAGAFLGGARYNKHDTAFVELWKRNPKRKLGFRFGYVDAAGVGHLVVTRPR